MNVLVTGAKGQLGNELQRLESKYPQYRFVWTDVANLDITNQEAIRAVMEREEIDWVLNCAAYTAVDKAEDDQELCYRINRDAVRFLAEEADRRGATLLHISTDYVFDGCAYRPYVEEDVVAPASVYGQSKLQGEQEALRFARNVVIRTSWLYSGFGNNFVKTMLRLGAERPELGVVFDQVGTPTYAADLAEAMLKVMGKIDRSEVTNVGGVYHFSNEGACSWYDFTKSIHRLAGVTNCKVMPIEASQFPAKAPRPHYSILNKRKIKQIFSLEIPHWEESLEVAIRFLAANN